MTTIVPTSEEDPLLAIVRFTSQLAWADTGPEVYSLVSGTPNMCKRLNTLILGEQSHAYTSDIIIARLRGVRCFQLENLAGVLDFDAYVYF